MNWFDELSHDAKQRGLPMSLLRYLDENRERIISTIELLEPYGLRGKPVCEIGPGGIGLACREHLGADVEGYDCSDWSKPMCDAFKIPWHFVDLHTPGIVLGGPYDAVLMCEVIEHLARWPADVLAEIRSALKPGGVLIVTTQNLHRLSQRVRMLTGRRLFAHFVREELVMAHLREYTPEELVYLFRRAGFEQPRTKLLTYPDLTSSRAIQVGYSLTCRVFPRLSNVICCWATR